MSWIRGLMHDMIRKAEHRINFILKSINIPKTLWYLQVFSPLARQTRVSTQETRLLPWETRLSTRETRAKMRLSSRERVVANTLACVASVSSRVIARKVEWQQKNRLKGEGEGRIGNACRQASRFWKTPLEISRFVSFVNWQLVKIKV